MKKENRRKRNENKDNNTNNEIVPSNSEREVLGSDDSSVNISASITNSPIPKAEELNKYGEIDRSFPERILSMAEKMTAHVQHMENKVMDY
jgi:uncharacterized membrane protein